MGAARRATWITVGRRLVILGAALAACALLLIAAASVVAFRPEGHALTASRFLSEPISPLLLALGLWVLGLFAERLGRLDLSWVLLLLSALVSSGRWAASGSGEGLLVYLLLLLWTGPSIFGLHEGLLSQPVGCAGVAGSGLLYLAALVLSIPLAIWPLDALRAADWFGVWRAAVTLPLPVAGGLSALLLMWFRLDGWPEVRLRHIRLVAFGTLVAGAPVVLLSVLPRAWSAPVYVPLGWTTPVLLLWPAYYLYALVPQGERLDEHFRRVSVGLLVATVLVAGFLGASALLEAARLPPEQNWPLLAALGAAALWLGRNPLWQTFYSLAEGVWVGRGASYTQVVGRLAESLSATLEPVALRRSLVHKLSRAMHISWSALFLREEGQVYRLAGSHGLAPAARLAHGPLPAGGALATFLAEWGRPVTHRGVVRALRNAPLGESEQALLTLHDVAFWVPLTAGGALSGILLIGPRPGSELFAREDMQILTTLGHQSGVAIQNTRLVEEVQAGRQELAQAHQQLLDAGEQERLLLARELHDGAVQQLIGISYQLAAGLRVVERAAEGEDGHDADAISTMLEETRQEVLGVVSQLRTLIGELRPPGLEDLGLNAALRGYVAGLERELAGAGPHIALDLQAEDRLIPQRVALCLFRVAQESLRNALRHAQATRVDLILTLYGGYVGLRVVDDGRGFAVPGRLSEMAARNHYGLMSMSERVAQVGGLLDIHSTPGTGTEVRVQVALGEEATRYEQDPDPLGRRSPVGAGGDQRDPIR